MSSIFFVHAFFFFLYSFEYLLCYAIYIFYFWRTGLLVSFWTTWMMNTRKRRRSNRRRLLVLNHKRIVEPCWGDSAGWLRLRNPHGVSNFVFRFFSFILINFFLTPHFGATLIISALLRWYISGYRC